MTLQLGICVIVAVLLMGSVSCALRGMDRRDEGDEGYAIWSVGMMLGAIVGILFLLFGPNGVLDDSSSNAAEFPSVNIMPTSVQK
ncbi:hypothetical protein [Actinomyces oris]|uniref:hypothetical protein n=1 Tax=Actinomyces oris TaxID=544580 RepID=UPI0028D3DC79|nr:hypothetical protein [Actinomyces oris]